MKIKKRSLLLASLSMLIAACTSPSAQFYSLTPALMPATKINDAPFYLKVDAIKLPDYLNKQQWVIQNQQGQIYTLEFTRWSAPFSTEIRQYISNALNRQLQAIDIYHLSTQQAKKPIYRVQTAISNFALIPGKEVALTIQWRINRVNSQSALTCQSQFVQAISTHPEEIIQAHRQLLDQLAKQMAQVIQKMQDQNSSRLDYAPITCPTTSATTALSTHQ